MIITTLWKVFYISKTKSSSYRSQWPRGLRCGSAAARLLGLWVWIPSVAWKSVPLWVLCVVR